MKAKNLMKGLLTICVLFVGLSLNATLGEISVSGFITSDEGEPLSETTITCSGSQAKISSISGSGFYSVSSLRNNDVLTFYIPVMYPKATRFLLRKVQVRF